MACGHFKAGRVDAEEFRVVGDGHGRLDPQRHFIARASGNSMNGGKNPIKDGDYLLLERLSSSNAGAITGAVMAIERQDESRDNQYLLRVALKEATGGHTLRANNPDYANMSATDDMRTLARFKEIIDPPAEARASSTMSATVGAFICSCENTNCATARPRHSRITALCNMFAMMAAVP